MSTFSATMYEKIMPPLPHQNIMLLSQMLNMFILENNMVNFFVSIPNHSHKFPHSYPIRIQNMCGNLGNWSLSDQRNGRSPRSSQKGILSSVQITEQLLVSYANKILLWIILERIRVKSDCRQTGGILRKGNKKINHESQNTDAQVAQAPATTLYVLDMGYPLHLIDLLAKQWPGE